jgi:uncharacterized damage-inducible protein DinB
MRADRRRSRRWAIVLASGVSLFTIAEAQQPQKVAAFLHGALAEKSVAIMSATEKMPASAFAFKPVDQPMTFGELTTHITDGNYIYCSRIGGLKEPDHPPPKDQQGKSELIRRLKQSFDYCATSLANIETSNLSETLVFGDAKTSRSMAILTLTASWVDHLVMQAEYLAAAGNVTTVRQN